MSNHTHTRFSIKDPVYVGDEQSFDEARAFLDADILDRGLALKNFNDSNRQFFELTPIHSDEYPISFLNEKNELQTVLLWVDADRNNWASNSQGVLIPPFETALAVIMDVIRDEDGKPVAQRPVMVVAGEDFQGVLEYRASCCGSPADGFSAIVFLKNEAGQTTIEIADAFTTKEDMKQYFLNMDEKGGAWCNTAFLKDLYMNDAQLSAHVSPGAAAPSAPAP